MKIPANQNNGGPVLARRGLMQCMFGGVALMGCASRALVEDVFGALERSTGAEIGLAAIDTRSGRTISHRGDQRFAMCSTFKWLLGGILLQRADRGLEDMARRLTFNQSDLVYHSPVTRDHLGEAGMSIAELCEATIQTSDNTAANLLLAELGGPSGFTDLVRESGDPATRLDRLEPFLNENAPGDIRDTTTPVAMATLMQDYLFGSALSDQSRELLRAWMIGANTGLDRLRAGFPQGWTGGDKTGTSSNRANNDVAFAIPPVGSGAAPIIIVSLTNVAEPISVDANALHARIARKVFDVLVLS